MHRAGPRGTIGAVEPGTSRFFSPRPDGRIACTLCPNACIIAEARHGVCGVRFTRQGTLQIPFYPVVYAVGVCCFLQFLVLLGDLVKVFRGKYE